MSRKPSDITVTDLFCGAGGSSSGAAAAGVRPLLALNHWRRAIETHNTNFPDAEHHCVDVMDMPTTRVKQLRPTHILVASPECFPAGTLVTTLGGQVPIESIAVGALVLTHQNRWRRVVRIQSRVADTVVLCGQGMTIGLEMTPNHRVWARASRKRWHPERREWDAADWCAADQLIDAHAYWSTPTHFGATCPGWPVPLGQEDEVWWVVGRWLGDGSLTFGRNHEVLISCGNHEADALERDLASRTRLVWRRDQKRTGVVFRVGHRGLRDWLHRSFGHGSENKGLPGWVYGLTPGQRALLLAGYVSADGHCSSRRTRVDTVSKRLAISVRLLAESLGHRAGVYRYPQHATVIEGRILRVLDVWAVAWENNGSSRYAFEDAGKAWSRVRRVQAGRRDVTVYNIEVDEDHSYVADGVVVANCTNHSQARTKKAEATLFDPHGADEAERSRATMMDVPRFAEQHGYEIVVVENVVEVLRWAGYTPWLQYMRNLGYEHQLLFINSLIAHPTPQSRDRFYAVFWKRRNRRPELRFAPPSWCPACEVRVDGVQSWRRADRRAGKYRTQYDYRCPACAGLVYPYAYPAASAIDWALPTQRIGDRARPLAPATRRRVEVGLERFGHRALVQASGHLYERPGYTRAWSPEQPGPTQTGANTMGVALSPPFLALLRSGRARTVGIDEPLATVVADGSGHALVHPPAWLLSTARQNDLGHRPRPAEEPMPTQTGQAEWAIAFAPFVAELRGGSSDVRGVDEPLATVTASGNHHALVVPAFYVKNYGRVEAAKAMAHHVSEPLGTVTGVDHHSLVTMPFLTSYYGQGGATPVSEPVPTVTTRDRHALVEPAVEVDDCGFRMLEPHEIQRAMAFADDYAVLGNKRERVRQLGNAVTPPVMRMLIERCVETLA